MKPLYEGKAKQLFETENENELRLLFKDDATAFNGEKHAILEGKGKLNNAISALFFELLESQGVPTHYIRKQSETEQLVQKTRIFPLEVVVRNRVAGSLVKRLGWEEGRALFVPLVEWYYKDDALGDPLVNADHIAALQVATAEELKKMRALALRINEIIQRFVDEAGLILVDLKLEFGLLNDGTLVLADEVSPDTCRFWNKETKETLDKDLYRYELGSLLEGYQTVLNRIGGVLNG